MRVFINSARIFGFGTFCFGFLGRSFVRNVRDVGRVRRVVLDFVYYQMIGAGREVGIFGNLLYGVSTRFLELIRCGSEAIHLSGVGEAT